MCVFPVVFIFGRRCGVKHEHEHEYEHGPNMLIYKKRKQPTDSFFHAKRATRTRIKEVIGGEKEIDKDIYKSLILQISMRSLQVTHLYDIMDSQHFTFYTQQCHCVGKSLYQHIKREALH